jgi:hypothetical protein
MDITNRYKKGLQMKRFHILGSLFVLSALVACNNGKTQNADATGTDSLANEVEVVDSALYGVVGNGTSMHSIELKDESGKTSTYQFDVDMDADIQGGLFGGDRITLVLGKTDSGEKEVKKAVNLTSLCGKWTALDRNFEIMEDGTVKSSQNIESNPYTHWSMVNCNLVLNRDTFDVLYIGPDSLTIENKKGIFVYKRQK